MTKRLLIALTIWLYSASLQAEFVSSSIDGSGNVQSQSIAVLSGNEFVFYPAQLEKTEGKLLLSAEVPGITADTLIAGIAVLAEGRVVSSALRRFGDAELNLNSGSLVNHEIDRLRLDIATQQRRLEELQTAVDLKGSALRREAGLHEVDAIYDRVKELEQQIKALKAQ